MTRPSHFADKPAHPPVGGMLTCALLLFPFPTILILLVGNYAPRVKLCWTLAALLELAAAGALMAATLYHLQDVMVLL